MKQRRNTQARTRRDAPGLSLVELVALIAIAAIVSAVAIPSLGSMARSRQLVAGDQLKRDLLYARSFAISTGAHTWVTFDTPNNAYTVLAEDINNPGRAGASVLNDPATGSGFVVRLDTDQFAGVGIESVDIDDGAQIGFDWTGSPESDDDTPIAQSAVITLTGGHAVTVEPGTGFVTVEPAP